MKFPDKKTAIGYLVALLLGALGGFTGKDLSGFQQPAEKVVTVVVDKVADKVVPPAVVIEPPAVAPVVDAGPAVVK